MLLAGDASLHLTIMADITYDCDDCGKQFKRFGFYLKHRETRACQQRFECTECGTSFSYKHNLTNHVKVTHANYADVNHVFHCGFCHKRFAKAKEAQQHRLEHMEKLEESGGSAFGFDRIAHAHKKKCELLRYVFPDHIHFVGQALTHIMEPLELLLTLKQLQHSRYKVAFILYIEFAKIDEYGKIETVTIAPFRTPTKEVLPMMNVEPLILEGFYHLISVIETYTSRGSGWAINDILYFQAEFAQTRPLSGGSGCGPHEVVRVGRDVNCAFTNAGFSEGQRSASDPDTKNCFYLAIASYFVESGDKEELEDFIRNNLVAMAANPVKLERIPAFEAANETLDMSINVVYKTETNTVYPVHVSKRTKAKNVICLMLGMTDGGSGITDLHYAYVRDPNSMFAPRCYGKKNDKSRKRTGSVLCFNCMNFQRCRDAYEKHILWCHQFRSQHIHMPRPGDTMSFKDKPRIKGAFTIFYDFEAANKVASQCSCPQAVVEETARVESLTQAELEDEIIDTFHQDVFVQYDWPVRKKFKPTKKKLCEHKTRTLKEQKAISYALVMMDRDGLVVEERFYIGDDAAEHFMKTVLQLEQDYLIPLLKSPATIVITEEDKERIENATECVICGEILGNDRVVDHDHLSSRVHGVCHSRCNLLRKESAKIVLYAHSWTSYDSHFIIKVLSKFRKQIKRLNSIPLNTERFKMLRVNHLVFVDSFAFLSESLEKLTETLVESDHKFTILDQRKWGNCVNPENGSSADSDIEGCCRDLLLRKGVYPYDFVTSIELLEKTTELPEKKHFFNRLGEEDISDEDYAHAQKVWRQFGCRNMADYTKLYNMSDVYLLAEVVTNLRDSIWDEFSLDICDFLSLPMLAKEVMLLVCDVDVELISDQEISHAFASSIRGGHSFIGTRFADVEELNQTMEKGSKVAIAYLDCNNL